MPRDPNRELLAAAVELEEQAAELRQMAGGRAALFPYNRATAPVELSEYELRFLIRLIPDPHDRPEIGNFVLDKLLRALAIEQGSGGNFNGESA